MVKLFLIISNNPFDPSPFRQPTAIIFRRAQEVNGRRRSWGWGRLTPLKFNMEPETWMVGRWSLPIGARSILRGELLNFEGGYSIPLWQTFFFWVVCCWQLLTCLTIRFSISFCFILCNLSRTLVVEICHQLEPGIDSSTGGGVFGPGGSGKEASTFLLVRETQRFCADFFVLTVDGWLHFFDVFYLLLLCKKNNWQLQNWRCNVDLIIINYVYHLLHRSWMLFHISKFFSFNFVNFEVWILWPLSFGYSRYCWALSDLTAASCPELLPVCTEPGCSEIMATELHRWSALLGERVPGRFGVVSFFGIATLQCEQCLYIYFTWIYDLNLSTI